MPFEFHLPWLLLGLVAILLPVLIHLLNRRRFDIVEWGAMRFLKISQKTRRKIFIEDILLLILRMLLVAVLVVGLAGPFLTRTVTVPGSRPVRDLVFVVDGSASMGCLTADGKQTAQQVAIAWANGLLDDLQPGDSVGLIDAREQPIVLLAPTVDHGRVRKALADLPAPDGGCDAPAAITAARQLLKDSTRGPRDILVLTDGQRSGYADRNAKIRWELLASQERAAARRDDHRASPVVNLVLVDPKRATDPPNWSLGPLRTTRGVVPAGREVLFRGDIELSGQGEDERGRPKPTHAPHRLALVVDGKPVRDLKLPSGLKFENGKVPYSFTHRFPRPGSHLVTVLLEPDPPADDRPADYKVRDHVPADNRVDYALEVVPILPVLLVDGGNDPDALDRGVAYLRTGLAPAADPTPAVAVEAMGVSQFDASALTERGTTPRPRVVIFQDVASLSQTQSEAVEQFLKDGGGVLVALGPNTDAAAWNERCFRQGRGWLPTGIDKSDGNENNAGGAAHVMNESTHPAMEIFRDVRGPGSIETARFPRWWRTPVPGRDAPGNIIGMLRTPASETPFLVERSVGAGRVILCATPLDASWGATLPRLPAFVPLVNELTSYLAGVRTEGYNLAAGQPLRFRSDGDLPLDAFTLQLPGSDRVLPLHASPAPPDTIAAQKTAIPPRGMAVTSDVTVRGGVYRLAVPRRVAVLCPDDQATRWKQAGAIEAGDESLLKRLVENHWLDFDELLCTSTHAPKLQRLEKTLRPRGLLPDEPSGTLLSPDVNPEATLKERARRAVYYVVGRDRAEADLTPLSQDDRADLTRLLDAKFLADREAFRVERQNAQERPELWWMLLLGLVALLCGEVWLTSRIARTRPE
jgi:hypothetical protein